MKNISLYMNYFNIDYLIVYAFLLITLYIGLRAGRGIKDIREYAIANKSFGTAALVLTYLATEVGGQGVINIAGEAGTTGIIIIAAFMSFPLAFIVQALFIAPKMARFTDCLTMGDLMGTLYGRNVKMIVGVFSYILNICYAGAELIMLGLVCESLLGLDYKWGILMGGAILTFYVMHGGMKSVTITDLLQFLVLLIILPVLTAIALKQAGGIKEVFMAVPSEKLQIWEHKEFFHYLALFLAFGVFHFTLIDPALIQRILMAKHARQIRDMFLVLAGFFTALFLTFMMLGVAGHQLYPTLAATDIVPSIIKDLVPEGLCGLMMAGIVAVVMASTDSYLHAAGITLVHDVLQPLHERKKIAIDELKWVRYAILVSGLLIVSIGLMKGENVYSLVFLGLEFATPLLVFPFFTGIMGLKPHRQAFYVSVGVTLGTFLLGKLLLPGAYSDFLGIICVVASGITFLGIHFVRNNGFVVVDHSKSVA